MYFIAVQIFFLNSVNSELSIPRDNITAYATSQDTVRLKRSPIDTMPSRLIIKIEYENGEQITLTWIRSSSYVANEHLPVIVPLASKKWEVMKDIGEFVAYYDATYCSAVVYFQKLNSFSGVISTDYYIENLPFNFDSAGNYRLQVVGRPYVKKRTLELHHIRLQNFFPSMSSTNSWENHLRLPDLLSEVTNNQIDYDNSINLQGDPNSRSTSSKRFHTYYCEILVFVAQDIVEHFLRFFGADHYIESIVRYYIVYFHTVDMMFRTISSLDGCIRINIAKILIEDKSTPFSFLNMDILQFSNIAAEIPNYFSTFKNYYPEDSFDHVFIHTSRAIWDGSVRRNGISKQSIDLAYARKNDIYYYAVPITIMGYKFFHADYITTVHALGERFGMNHDSNNQELMVTRRCPGVMQQSGSAYNNCLRWSCLSMMQITKFLRASPNRCFLSNYPRSLNRPGPSRLHTPNWQCKCFGYDSHKTFRSGKISSVIRTHECNEPLVCERYSNSTIYQENTMRPFDGVPCGQTGKVCWNRQCLKV